MPCAWPWRCMVKHPFEEFIQITCDLRWRSANTTESRFDITFGSWIMAAQRPPRVAIIGGGLAGLSAATHLLNRAQDQLDVTLFDMGARGVGGRASHRTEPHRFSHGLQFLSLHPSAPLAHKEVIQTWLDEDRIVELPLGGWLDAQRAQYTTAKPPPHDGFFGAMTEGARVYIPKGGGVRTLCQSLAEDALAKGLTLRTQCRVREVAKHLVSPDGPSKWHLFGNTADNAVHHEMSEKAAKAAADEPLGESFDALVITDSMMFLEKWHRCSLIGLASCAPNLVAKLGGTVPMEPLGFAVNALVVAAAAADDDDACCWTLVSTREFAEQRISEVPMRNASEYLPTWQYAPQEASYLLSDPAQMMLQALRRATGAFNAAPTHCLAQRWGAAYPQSSDGVSDGGACVVDDSTMACAAGDFAYHCKDSAASAAGGMAAILSGKAVADELVARFTVDVSHSSLFQVLV
ncbi:hypothetical protein NFJ02_12g09890 [Pycnococcus provasolii]